MRRTAILMAPLLLVASAWTYAASEAANVTVRVEGLRNATGTVNIGLYDENGRADFPGDQPFRAEIVAADTAAVEVTFADLPAGRYAVALIHDENGNNDLDVNDFGMPREGYGFSNGAGQMGAPSFAQAAVEIDEDATITVRMVYLGETPRS